MLDVEETVSGNGVSRRVLLIGAGATVAAVPFAKAAPGASKLLPDSDVYGAGIEVLYGIIGRVFGPQEMFVFGRREPKQDLQAIAVGLTPHAPVLREVPVTLTDLAPGEEVLLGGRWGETGFAAIIVEQSYRTLEGRVVRLRSGGRLETDKGIVKPAPRARAVGGPATNAHGYRFVAKPLSRIRQGDHVWAFGRRVGATDEFLALTVSTRARARRRTA